MRISLVAFDLDGTLVDSAPDLAAAVDRMLEETGLPPQGEAVVRAIVGDGARKLVERALTRAGIASPGDRDITLGLERFRRAYAERLCVHSRLFPGVRETLEWLAARKVRCAVITNKPGEFTRPLLAALGIESAFELVISGDTLPYRKPDPAPLLHAAAYCGIRPAQGCMVGDSRNDLNAARAAGFLAVLVRGGYHGEQDLAALHPDALLASLAELPAFLDSPAAGVAGSVRSR